MRTWHVESNETVRVGAWFLFDAITGLYYKTPSQQVCLQYPGEGNSRGGFWFWDSEQCLRNKIMTLSRIFVNTLSRIFVCGILAKNVVYAIARESIEGVEGRN